MKEELSPNNTFHSWLWLGLFSLIFLLSLRKIINYDIWFHLRTAQYVMNQGEIPTSNIFSFSNYGVAWDIPEWFAQIIFYLVFLAGSYSGLVFFKGVVVLSLFILIFKQIDRGRRYSTTALFLVWAAFCGSYFRFTIRPHILFYLWISGLFYLLALYQGGAKVRGLLPLAFMLAMLWGNTHGSAFYALIVSGAFILSAFVKPLLSSEATQKDVIRDLMLLTAVLFLAVSFNPYGLKIYWYPFWHFSKENMYQASILTEYRQPELKDFFGPISIFLPLAPLVFYSLWQKRRYAYLLLLAFFTYTALRHIRLMGFFFLVATPIFVNNLPRWRLLEKKAISLVIFSLMIFGGLFYLKPQLYAKKEWKLGLGVDWQLYPRKAARFIQDNLKGRQGGNEYRWGGYLLWSLPERKVFIDGRFPDYELFNDYIKMMKNGEELRRVTEKYQLDYVLIPRINAPAPQKPGWLFAKERWGLVYWDSNSYLFLRRTTENLPLLERFEYRIFNPLLIRLDALPVLIKDKDNQPKLKKDLEQAYQADSGNLLAAQALGDFYQLTGEQQKELTVWQRFAAEKPRVGEGWFRLGRAYEMLQKNPQAEEAYLRALKLQPQLARAEKRLARLKASRKVR